MNKSRSTFTRVIVEQVDGSQSIFAGIEYWPEYQRLTAEGLSGKGLIDRLLPGDVRPPPRLVTLVVEGKEMARIKYE